MKRLLCLVLIISAIICLCGCNRSSQQFNVPAKFYYCTIEESYKTEHVTLKAELREAESYANNLDGLLNQYLLGPKSNELTSPFPDSVIVESVTRNNATVSVILSSRFARLSGISLTLACACLSMTIMDYTDCESVCISVRNILLDGNEYITMTKNSLLLYDTYAENTQ